MPNPNDRRVRKTRAALRSALEQLLHEKSLPDITVKELCAVSGLNRGTFYLHYQDVHALLDAIEHDLMTEFTAVLEPLTCAGAFAGPAPSPAMTAMFRFLAQNAAMCRALLCHNADNAFLEQVETFVHTRLVQEYGARFAGGDIVPEYAFSFVVSGCIGMLQQWLEADMPLSAQRMAALVQNIVARGFAALTQGGVR